jgi:hypothetical protein
VLRRAKLSDAECSEGPLLIVTERLLSVSERLLTVGERLLRVGERLLIVTNGC